MALFSNFIKIFVISVFHVHCRYREAEIAHGRVAQLAVVGNLWPGLFGHLPGNPDIGVPADAFAQLNPYTALETVPEGALLSSLPSPPPHQ